ncbi:MAG TPA: hypothetical protein VFP80_08990 [Thermoanaerobaculia bacterium]|nr:hypothetical protein [Thermoanaerobaculia bacterium]
MARKLEIATNIAILIAATLASVVLVRNFLFPRTANSARPPSVAVGTTLSVPGFDWRSNGNTVVLALSTNCHFCSESAPFYRRLADELSRRRVHLTAVLPQDANESGEYLRALQLAFGDVRQIPLRTLQIRGTPTLLLVDERGVVRHVWEGKLTAEREQQVLETVLAIPARPTPVASVSK